MRFLLLGLAAYCAVMSPAADAAPCTGFPMAFGSLQVTQDAVVVDGHGCLLDQSTSTWSSSAGCAWVKGAHSAIRNFSFANCEATSDDTYYPPHGGGVLFHHACGVPGCDGSDTNRPGEGTGNVSSCTFRSSSAGERGGGIYFDKPGGRVSACVFESTSARDQGGGIFFTEFGSVADSQFRNATTKPWTSTIMDVRGGGGVAFRRTATAEGPCVVIRCDFHGTMAWDHTRPGLPAFASQDQDLFASGILADVGGAGNAWESRDVVMAANITVSHCRFQGMQSHLGGSGLITTRIGIFGMDSCSFLYGASGIDGSSGSPGAGGGAVKLLDRKMLISSSSGQPVSKAIRLTRSSFMQTRSNRNGGAVLLGVEKAEESLLISECHFNATAAAYDGGAIVSYAAGTISSCTFSSTRSNLGDSSGRGSAGIDMKNTGVVNKKNAVTDCKFVKLLTEFDASHIPTDGVGPGGAAILIRQASGDLYYLSGFDDCRVQAGSSCGLVASCNFTSVGQLNTYYKYGRAVNMLRGEVVACNFLAGKSDDDPDRDRGALRFQYRGHVEQCSFENSTAWRGGAIFIDPTNDGDTSDYLLNKMFQANNTVIESVFKRTVSCARPLVLRGGGGGIYLGGGHALRVDGCQFAQTTTVEGQVGGAIAALKSRSVVALNSVFDGAVASAAGGALYFYSDTPDQQSKLMHLHLDNCTFKNCAAIHGGGHILRIGGHGSFDNLFIEMLNVEAEENGFTPSLQFVSDLDETTGTTVHWTWPSECPTGRFVQTGMSNKTVPFASWSSRWDGCPGECAIGETARPGATGLTHAEQCVRCPEGYFGVSDILASQRAAVKDMQAAMADMTTTSSGYQVYAAAIDNLESLPKSAQCASCPLGTYVNKEGSTSVLDCSICPDGKNCHDGNIEECSRGRRCVAGMESECIKIGGVYQNKTGKSKCEFCPEGFYEPNIDLLIPTWTVLYLGEYLARWNTAGTRCTPCAQGKYRSSIGGQECFTCSEGRYQNETGRSVCKACAVGTARGSSSSNGTSCQVCEPGQFQATPGGLECSGCPDGQFQEEVGESICKLCMMGTIRDKNSDSDSNGTTCQVCVAGTVQGAVGQRVCINCPRGQFQDQNGVNHYVRHVLCKTCPDGYVQWHTSKTKCEFCMPGQYSDTDRIQCKSCLGGRYQNETGRSVCKACAVGTARGNSGSNGTTCQLCEPGQFQATSGGLECSGCGTIGGVYQNETGKSKCEFCPEGFFKSNFDLLDGTTTYDLSAHETVGTSCTPCAQGQYRSSIGGQECFTCSEGRYQNETGRSVCKACAVGTARGSSRSNGTSCQLCEPGQFQATPGGLECSGCPEGQFQDIQGRGSCKACPPGTFTQFGGQSICTNCTFGSYQASPLQSACIYCEAGTEQSLRGQSECTSCADGYFWSASNAGSVVPQAVFITSVKNQNDKQNKKEASTKVFRLCKSCKAGRHSDADRAACTACAAGMYQNTTGQSVCKTCPHGYIHMQQRYLCLQCRAGFHSNTELTQCETCPTGRMQHAPGETACNGCSQGTFQDAVSATACDICPAGKHQSSSGKSSCSDCGPGTYQDQPQQSGCKECDQGTFQDGSTATICESCANGQYQELRGDSDCKACASGKTTRAGDHTSCASCAPGTFLNAASCENCGAGTYSIIGSECVACAAGQYQSLARQSGCLACGDGNISSPDKTSCTTCPPGTYSNKATCSECASGYQQPHAGSSICDKCGMNEDASTARTSCFCKDNFIDSSSAHAIYVPETRNSSRTASAATGLASDIKCTPCIAGAVCLYGLALPRPGFWVAGTASQPQILPCSSDHERACVGSLLWVSVSDAQCNTSATEVDKESVWEAMASIATSGELRKSFEKSADSDDAAAFRKWVDAQVAEAATSGQRCGTSQGCAVGHTGPLCVLCEALHAKDGDGNCIACTEKLGNKSMFLLTVFILSSILVLVGIKILTAKQNAVDDGRRRKRTARQHRKRRDAAEEGKEEDGANQAANRIVDASEVGADVTDVLGMLQTLVPYVQRISAFDLALPIIAWPAIMTTALKALKLMYLDICSLLTKLGPCELHTTFKEQTLVALITVPWLSAVAAGAYAGAWCVHAAEVRKIKRRKAVARRLRAQQVAADTTATAASTPPSAPSFELRTSRARLLGIWLLALKFAFPGLSAQILSVFACTAVPGAREDGQDLMMGDFARPCGDPELASLAVVGVLVFVMGVPIVMTAAIAWDHRTMRLVKAAHDRAVDVHGMERRQVKSMFLVQHASTVSKLQVRAQAMRRLHREKAAATVHQAVNWFTDKYKKTYWWWATMELILSLFLIAVLGLITDLHAQVVAALFASMAQLVLPAFFRPYAEDADNHLACLGGFVYFLILLSGLAKMLLTFAIDRGDGLGPGSSGDAADATTSGSRARALQNVETVISVVFVAGLISLIVATLVETFARHDRRVHKKKVGRHKVVPVGKSKVARTTTAEGKDGGDSESSWFGNAESSRVVETITRASIAALRRCPKSLRQEYVERWNLLYASSVEVAALQVQSLVRGSLIRKPSGAMRNTFAVRKAMQGTTASAAVVAAAASKQTDAAAAAASQRARGAVGVVAGSNTDADLARALEAERNKNRKLERRLSSVRQHQTLDKAQDEALARQMIEDDKRGFEEALKQRKLERQQTEAKASLRRQKSRRRHLLRALRAELASHDDAEIAQILDPDNDLVVTKQELFSRLQQLSFAKNHEIHEEDVRLIRQELDADGDGVVMISEVIAEMRKER